MVQVHPKKYLELHKWCVFGWGCEDYPEGDLRAERLRTGQGDSYTHCTHRVSNRCIDSQHAL